MVDDDIALMGGGDCIVRDFVLIAQAQAQKAQDQIVGIQDNGIALDTDAVTGRCLTGHGQIAVFDHNRRLQGNGSRHVKDHSSRPPGFEGSAQTACSAVLQMGDRDHPTAAAARSESPVSFGARKRQRSGTGGRKDEQKQSCQKGNRIRPPRQLVVL